MPSGLKSLPSPQRATSPAPRGHPAPDADVGAADGGLVDEDTPDKPQLFEEEDDEPELPEHEAPEPEDVHEEAPIPVLNRFLALLR